MWKVFQDRHGSAGGHDFDSKNTQMLLINIADANLSSWSLSALPGSFLDPGVHDTIHSSRIFAYTSRKLVGISRKLFHIASRSSVPAHTATSRTLQEIHDNFDRDPMTYTAQVHEG